MCSREIDEASPEVPSFSTSCTAQERLQSPVPELDALILLSVNIVASPLFMSSIKKSRIEEQIQNESK